MNAVFHLSVIWTSGKIHFLSLLNRATIGYFSFLSSVEEYLETAREKDLWWKT